MTFFEKQNSLTPDERALRDAFVDQFFFDFKPYEACVRMGMEVSPAAAYAVEFMSDTYVLQKIRERMEKGNVTEESEVEKDKRLVIHVLRETMMNGTHSAKVNAARQLSEMRGFSETKDDTAQALVDAFKEIAGKVE